MLTTQHDKNNWRYGISPEESQRMGLNMKKTKITSTDNFDKLELDI